MALSVVVSSTGPHISSSLIGWPIVIENRKKIRIIYKNPKKWHRETLLDNFTLNG